MIDDTMPAGPDDDLDLGGDETDEDFDFDFGDEDEDEELPSVVIETPNGSVVSIW